MMGELKFFLGLQIKQYIKCIYIFINGNSKEFLKMEEAKPMKTPMHAINPLSKEKLGKLVDRAM